MTGGQSDRAEQIGATVRAHRKEKGLTLRDLSERTGLSPAFLSLAERGLSSFALTSLRAVAEAMDLEISDLLEVDSNASSDENESAVSHAEIHTHHSDEPAAIEIIASGYRYRLLSPAWSGKQLEPLHVTVPADLHDETPAGHAGEEICYVLSGVIVFLVGEEEHNLRAGDSIHIDSRIPHALRNTSGAEAETLWVVSPPIFGQSHLTHVPSMKRREL